MLSAPAKCPTGLVPYMNECLPCSYQSGPICAKEGREHKKYCELTYKGRNLGLSYVLIDGECKIDCPTGGFPVCATGSNGEGIYFDNYCLQLSAGYIDFSYDYYAQKAIGPACIFLNKALLQPIFALICYNSGQNLMGKRVYTNLIG